MILTKEELKLKKDSMLRIRELKEEILKAIENYNDVLFTEFAEIEDAINSLNEEIEDILDSITMLEEFYLEEPDGIEMDFGDFEDPIKILQSII